MYNSSEKEKEEKQSRNIVFTFHPDSALALADSSFRFNPFSSSPSQQQQQAGQTANPKSDAKPEPEDPKGADFDPEALERGAKALLEINSSPHAKQVFDVMRKQEQSRLAEVAAEKSHCEVIQAQIDIEESSILKEQARRATEEQIQAQQCQTEKERAEIEGETTRVKAMAEAEGWVQEVKLTGEHNRRMLIEHINGEREKWLASTFSHIEGATTLAAGIYTTRHDTLDWALWTGLKLGRCLTLYAIWGSLEDLIKAKACWEMDGIYQNQHNMCGLGYAMMTGGDVAPLGAQAVTKIHEIFDWAKKSQKGLLLFIDKADAFLSERNSMHMSEAQQSALNALLLHTGDQSKDSTCPCYKQASEGDNGSSRGSLFKRPQKITVNDISEDVIREAAKKTEGFSGREIAKVFMARSMDALIVVLDSQLFSEIVDYKVAEHNQRLKLAAEYVLQNLLP
ncbi:hypothetical protein POTOM_019260 [Populus tomentosa]|uniref:Uncharacterized protein n=1 Tax=Populus tomentosa TaxID=118781 RepID=A0A8X7ZV59_POPTO|nr:hypothetical protein POTOM_019260 [Populus tomentosa]